MNTLQPVAVNLRQPEAEIYLGEYPPLKLDNRELTANQYEAPHGRRRVYFLDPDTSKSTEPEIARLSFIDEEAGIRFAGMFVKPEARGRGVGKALIRYLITVAGENEREFLETVVIRKPIIALSLARVGLQPDTISGFDVEILPPGPLADPDHPEVLLLNERWKNKMKPRKRPLYYTREDPLLRFPDSDSKTVRIHTRYALPPETQQ